MVIIIATVRRGSDGDGVLLRVWPEELQRWVVRGEVVVGVTSRAGGEVMVLPVVMSGDVWDKLNERRF